MGRGSPSFNLWKSVAHPFGAMKLGSMLAILHRNTSLGRWRRWQYLCDRRPKIKQIVGVLGLLLRISRRRTCLLGKIVEQVMADSYAECILAQVVDWIKGNPWPNERPIRFMQYNAAPHKAASSLAYLRSHEIEPIRLASFFSRSKSDRGCEEYNQIILTGSIPGAWLRETA